jgi:hypothetical protein
MLVQILIYIYIYNIETNEKKYIKRTELSTLFGGVNIAAIGKTTFIDDNHIYSGFRDWTGQIWYSFSWNILENRITNYFDFLGPVSVAVNDSSLLFCNGAGVIGLTDKKAVPVKDVTISNEYYLKYYNNQLEYHSNKSFTGQSMVYDTTGKLILNIGTQQFVIGNNIIKINQNLPIGIYILTMLDKTEQFSYKFIVE